MKYLDENGLLYLWGLIKNHVSNTVANKVDKVDGKGLSTNDFTDTLKTKIDGVETEANKYVHPAYTAKESGLYKVVVDAFGHVSSATQVVKSDITKLGIPSTVPTKVSELANDNGYQTASEVSAAITSALGGITGIDIQVVSTLPQTGTKGVIYLVSHSHGTSDAYDEYVWVASASKFEKIGNTDIDLSGYVLKTDIVAITNTEIDTIVAS